MSNFFRSICKPPTDVVYFMSWDCIKLLICWKTGKVTFPPLLVFPSSPIRVSPFENWGWENRLAEKSKMAKVVRYLKKVGTFWFWAVLLYLVCTVLCLLDLSVYYLFLLRCPNHRNAVHGFIICVICHFFVRFSYLHDDAMNIIIMIAFSSAVCESVVFELIYLWYFLLY